MLKDLLVIAMPSTIRMMMMMMTRKQVAIGYTKYRTGEAMLPYHPELQRHGAPILNHTSSYYHSAVLKSNHLIQNNIKYESKIISSGY